MEKLIKDVDRDYHVYDGTVFRQEKFAEYIARNNMQWPRTPVGRFDLSDATFKSKTEQYPQLQNLRELRSTLSQTRNLGLTVGSDGRNRFLPLSDKRGDLLKPLHTGIPAYGWHL